MDCKKNLVLRNPNRGPIEDTCGEVEAQKANHRLIANKKGCREENLSDWHYQETQLEKEKMTYDDKDASMAPSPAIFLVNSLLKAVTVFAEFMAHNRWDFHYHEATQE
tara:strand:+ start:237 stop:560 length:324 start_codon:yes stop_codon:yes gene_type:complete